MRKVNNKPGIYDRWYDKHGNKTKDYGCELRYRVRMHFRHKVTREEIEQSRCFPTIPSAEEWQASQKDKNRNADNPDYIRKHKWAALEGRTLQDLIFHHLFVVTKNRPTLEDLGLTIEDLRIYGDSVDLIGFPNELLSVREFALSSDLAQRPLNAIEKHHCVAWLEWYRENGTYIRKGWRAAKPIMPGSVRRLCNSLQAIFQKAIDRNYFGACGILSNPFKGIRLEGTKHQRRRTLMDGEEQKLFENFKTCLGTNRYYIPLAQYVAWDTGMRAREVTGLRWSDIGFVSQDPYIRGKRRIKIREDKNDKKRKRLYGKPPGRTTVLSIDTMLYLRELWHSLNDKGRLPNGQAVLKLKRPIDNLDSHIFLNTDGKPMSPDALGSAYETVVRNAALPQFDGETPVFHDLRRMAQNEFIRAGLEHPRETHVLLNQVGGHYEDGTLDHYLNPLQDALDRHFLKVPRQIDRIALDDTGQTRVLKETVMEGVTLEDYARIKRGRKVSAVEIWQDNVELDYTTRWRKAWLHDWVIRSAADTDDRTRNGKALVFQLQGTIENDDLGYQPLGFMTFKTIEDACDIPAVALCNMEDESGILKVEEYYFFSEARANEVLKDFPGGVKALEKIDKEETEIVNRIIDILVHKETNQPTAA